MKTGNTQIQVPCAYTKTSKLETQKQNLKTEEDRRGLRTRKQNLSRIVGGGTTIVRDCGLGLSVGARRIARLDLIPRQFYIQIHVVDHCQVHPAVQRIQDLSGGSEVRPSSLPYTVSGSLIEFSRSRPRRRSSVLESRLTSLSTHGKRSAETLNKVLLTRLPSTSSPPRIALSSPCVVNLGLRLIGQSHIHIPKDVKVSSPLMIRDFTCTVSWKRLKPIAITSRGPFEEELDQPSEEELHACPYPLKLPQSPLRGHICFRAARHICYIKPIEAGLNSQWQFCPFGIVEERYKIVSKTTAAPGLLHRFFSVEMTSRARRRRWRSTKPSQYYPSEDNIKIKRERASEAIRSEKDDRPYSEASTSLQDSTRKIFRVAQPWSLAQIGVRTYASTSLRISTCDLPMRFPRNYAVLTDWRIV
ncbi:hypothetical protein HS088_TW03G01206 [Tripterygium wilfordii]|uniref:Uncharacterized protein n=1 Tax=Tripterygium wilfordii TaxID=458696 RepID=A0A7J7DXN4_TRIWF|nr:hypothetical protein HS088_TW03G01206 [Tripterygium wilfordii]